MSAMTEEIYAIAAAVASPGEGEKDLLELLCAAAERELTAALRPGVTAADCREAFLCAAGYLAAAGLLGSRGREAEQLTAGEVSILRWASLAGVFLFPGSPESLRSPRGRPARTGPDFFSRKETGERKGGEGNFSFPSPLPSKRAAFSGAAHICQGTTLSG